MNQLRLSCSKVAVAEAAAGGNMNLTGSRKITVCKKVNIMIL